MILPEFEYHQPETLDAACALIRQCEGDYDFIAGGTDVLPNYKNRLNNRGCLISLSKVEELHQISTHSIGAMVTLAQLEKNSRMQEAYPILPEAARLVATPLLRESATVGGNILLDTRCWFFNQSHLWRASKGFCLKADGEDCLVVPQKETCYATYSGDLAPVFMVLGATFHLADPDGARAVPAGDFFAHDGVVRNVKSPEEILTHVSLPDKEPGAHAAYRKLRVRDSMDYPVMGVAVALRLAGKAVADIRIALTGTGTMPFLYDELTARYHGQELSDDQIETIAEEVMEEVKPYRNVHFSPQYRKAMTGVYLKRILYELRDLEPSG